MTNPAPPKNKKQTTPDQTTELELRHKYTENFGRQQPEDQTCSEHLKENKQTEATLKAPKLPVSPASLSDKPAQHT